MRRTDSVELPQLPEKLLDHCRLLLKHETSEITVRQLFHRAWPIINTLSDFSYEYGMGVYVPQIALAACETAMGVNEEIYEEQGWFDQVNSEEGCANLTDASIDSNQGWDVFFIASSIEAGGFLWEETASFDRRRDYYTHLLNTFFPLVAEPLEELDAILESGLN